jgi:hypothetical protein
MTPLENIYEKKASLVISYMPAISKVQEFENNLIFQAPILHTLKENFSMDHNHMKKQADQGRFECQFIEGDHVFLYLQPYKNTSLKFEHCHKISHKFYGPYTIFKRVDPVAYQLALPSHYKLHPIFHVSCLNKVIVNKWQTQTSLPELGKEGSIWLQPQEVLDQRECHLCQCIIK